MLSGGQYLVTDLESSELALEGLMNDLQQPIDLGDLGDLSPGDLLDGYLTFSGVRTACCLLHLVLGSSALSIQKMLDAFDGENLSKEKLDEIAKNLTFNVADMIQNARNAAAANDNDISLLDGAKKVFNSYPQTLRLLLLLETKQN